MSKGLYFYKLISPYEEDVTKNCRLTINEIDSNFLSLKDEDIKSAELDEVTKSVILTRNNGDKLVVDLTPILSGAVYDLEVVYENPSEKESGSCNGANVYVTYSILTEDDVKVTKRVPITGLVTTDNINDVLGGGLLSRVISDGSLTGDGTIDSPLGISLTEKNRPAVKLIDKTIGEELPETFTYGTRYITKEYISEYGYLYNFYAVNKIQERLNAEGKGWRIPTKADWDCLLNSIEPCDYRDHDSAMCHQMFGKYAGKKLKSSCGWLGQDDCECKVTKPIIGQYCPDDDTTTTDDTNGEYDPIDQDDSTPSEVQPECGGTDDFGMRILPTGYGDGGEYDSMYFNKRTVFWTSTHIYNDLGQDIYVKEFDWDKCGVIQEAQCPDALFSIRLVKDYTGNNHFETETIDGDNYSTILFPDCGAVWTSSNFTSDNPLYQPKEANMGQNPYKRVAYFINVWNGKEWEKRALSEGETVVIMEGNEHCQYNIEYRVYTEDGCNQTLINADDTVVQRVIERIVPLIDEEKEERIAADEALSGAIDTEREERIAADELEKEEREAADAILQEEIENETLRANEVEQQLWDAINQEAEARESVDQQLWDAVNGEAERAQDVEGQLWDALNNEISARTDVDSQLWDAIAQETSARTDSVNQLWDAINEEASARTDVDNQLWTAINGETERAQDVEGQLWDALNKEIEDRIADVDDEEARAKAKEDEIDGQLIDASENPYVLSANTNGDYNLVLKSKDGDENHFINIKFSADFGTF